MTSTRKRCNEPESHVEELYERKRRKFGHMANSPSFTHDARLEVENKSRVDFHSPGQRNVKTASPVGPISGPCGHARDHMPNPTQVYRKDERSPDTRDAISGNSKALNTPHDNGVSRRLLPGLNAPSISTPTNLTPPPPLPDNIAQVVFTHQGALPGGNVSKVDLSYDRLEFLGDAYIELIATRLILPRFPHLPVGRLSQQRELLIKNETLAEYSLAYGFDKRLRLPDIYKERQIRKPKLWTKLLGDVMEAYVAAVIISDPQNGFHNAETWLHSIWENKLATQQPADTHVMDANAKLSLSQRLMGRGIKLEYREEAPRTVLNNEGKVWFHIGAFLTGWGFDDVRLGGGKGLSKQEAGQIAAADASSRAVTAQIERIKKNFDMKTSEKKEIAENEGLGEDAARFGICKAESNGRDIRTIKNVKRATTSGREK